MAGDLPDLTMAIIPKETIEEIRARCNIIETIGAYLPELRQRGSTYKCRCPFHTEKTPSFTVNEIRQIFYCFGCGIGGDVFRFVMEYEKVDFVTAVHILAERVGLKIVIQNERIEKGSNKDVLYKLHSEAANFYCRMLLEHPEGAAARYYLKERSLPLEIIRKFQIGYAPAGWENLLRYTAEKNYSPEQLKAAGLAVSSERSGKTSRYDRFRNRIMFPINDSIGRVIGFSGRIMNKTEKGAKYVNSPETPLFHKNKVLYAFDKARKAIVESRRAILVEGQMDAIRCHQAGLENTVASQGTALTKNHARLLKRYADEIVLLLDSDAAGIKAALASSEIFIVHELSVRVAVLPEGEDPDSLLCKQGVEVLNRFVREAPEALEFLIDTLQLRENASSAEAGKMRVVQAVLNLIHRTPSAVRRDSMMHAAADRLKISTRILNQEFRRMQPHTIPAAASRLTADSPPQKQLPLQETALLELLIVHYHDVHSLVHDFLPPEYLTDPACRKLLEILMLDPPETLTETLHELDKHTQQLISRVQVQKSPMIDNGTSPVDLAQDYILLLWKHQLELDQVVFSRRKDISAEQCFKEITRIRHDLHILSRGWNEARPMLEARLHRDTNF